MSPTSRLSSGFCRMAFTIVCTKLLNTDYGQIADQLAAQGKKIVFVDTYNGCFDLSDLADGWHAFTGASQKGFITLLNVNGLPDGTPSAVCDKVTGDYYKDIGPKGDRALMMETITVPELGKANSSPLAVFDLAMHIDHWQLGAGYPGWGRVSVPHTCRENGVRWSDVVDSMPLVLSSLVPFRPYFTTAAGVVGAILTQMSTVAVGTLRV
ncbi:hypothetical protein BDV10DRAFT_187574 [Aspergillus recurvatus]